MAGVVCNPFYLEALRDALAAGVPVTFKLRLYSNNYNPTLGDVPANYTESAASGYAAVTLTPGSWTITTVAGHVKATYPSITFTLTGAGTVYGYYVTDSGGTVVEWAELATGGPFNFPAGGGTLVITLELDGP